MAAEGFIDDNFNNTASVNAYGSLRYNFDPGASSARESATIPKRPLLTDSIPVAKHRLMGRNQYVGNYLTQKAYSSTRNQHQLQRSSPITSANGSLLIQYRTEENTTRVEGLHSLRSHPSPGCSPFQDHSALKNEYFNRDCLLTKYSPHSGIASTGHPRVGIQCGYRQLVSSLEQGSLEQGSMELGSLELGSLEPGSFELGTRLNSVRKLSLPESRLLSKQSQMSLHPEHRWSLCDSFPPSRFSLGLLARSTPCVPVPSNSACQHPTRYYLDPLQYNFSGINGVPSIQTPSFVPTAAASVSTLWDKQPTQLRTNISETRLSESGQVDIALVRKYDTDSLYTTALDKRNKRERTRVRAVSAAFNILRRRLPLRDEKLRSGSNKELVSFRKVKKLSKVIILGYTT